MNQKVNQYKIATLKHIRKRIEKRWKIKRVLRNSENGQNLGRMDSPKILSLG